MAVTRTVLVTLMLSLLFTVESTSDSLCGKYDPRCPCLTRTYKMLTYQQRCFQFYYGSSTWEEANDYCLQQGGRLAMLNDRGTFQFVRSSLNAMTWKTEELWIGAHDMVSELHWVWANKFGEPAIPMTFTFWSPEHPGDWLHSYKDCVLMRKDGGRWRWHEAFCNMSPYEYKYICEYDMKNVSNEAGGINGVSGPQSTILSTIAPADSTHGTRHSNNHDTPPRGGHKKVTDPDNALSHIDTLNGEHDDSTAGANQKKDGHVPIYAVVVAFAGGTAFALFFVIFFITRRRRRRKSECPYSGVEYHAHPVQGERRNSPIMLGGAVGGHAVCETSGKLCKVAADVGAEACACTSDAGDICHGRNPRKASPNVYVSVDHGGMTSSGSDHGGCAIVAARMNSTNDSSVSTINNVGEAPPTYDEVCADILADHITSQSVEMPYENERLCQRDSGTSQASAGAIPKTPKRAPVADYIPMNGSGSNSPVTSLRNSHTSNASSSQDSKDNSKDTSQYIHMDRGKLPPIPTDEGYEIPVSRRLAPESERQARVSLIRPDSVTTGQSIYSEIPDRVSRCLSNEDEQIYSSID